MGRAPEDDLEVLPLERRAGEDALAASTNGAETRRPRHPVRTALAVVAALAVAAVVLIARGPGDDPAADVRTLDRLWVRVVSTSNIANRADVRVRILVPLGDSETATRGLTAVHAEERDRLHALGADVARVHTSDRRITQARDAMRQAIALRERRAGVAAVPGGREGGLDDAISTSTGDVERALQRLRQRFHLSPPPGVTVDAPSPALDRALGSLARVTDTPVGARLVLNIFGNLFELDPDAGVHGRVHPVSPPRGVLGGSVRSLVTLGDGTVLTWGADSNVRVVARPGGATTAVGPPLGLGRPIPSLRPDAFWLTNQDGATEVSVDGRTLAGPFPQPVDQVVAAVSTGLLTFDPQPEEHPTIGVWSPPDTNVATIAEGIPLAAAGDTVITELCGGAGCSLAIVDIRTRTTQPIDAPGDGGWSYTSAAISPNGRWAALGAHGSHVDGGLYFVDLHTRRTHLLRVPSQAEDLPVTLTWTADSRRVIGVTERDTNAVWASPTDRRVHAIHVQVAFDEVIRVRDVAVVPD